MPNGRAIVEASGDKGRGTIGRSALVGLLAWTLAVLSAAPSLHYFELSYIFNSRAGEFVQQCANPLTRAITGAPFLEYRVFLPTVAWLIGARLYAALALPYLGTLAFLSVVCLVMSRRHGWSAAIIATMLVATSFAVTWPDCMLGYSDSVAHLLAACLLLTRRPWLVAALVAAGVLSDERFLLELPFVLLWHHCASGDGDGPWLKVGWRPIIYGLALCLIIRRALTVGWIGPGITAPKAYDNLAINLASLHPGGMSWAMWLANVFMGFRWTWFVILAGLYFRSRRGQSLDVPLFVALLSACVASSMLVFDVARCVGFCWLAMLLSFTWLIDGAPELALGLGRASAWVSLLTPSVWFVPGYALWFRPLPLRVIAFVSNHDPLERFHWLNNVR